MREHTSTIIFISVHYAMIQFLGLQPGYPKIYDVLSFYAMGSEQIGGRLENGILKHIVTRGNIYVSVEISLPYVNWQQSSIGWVAAYTNIDKDPWSDITSLDNV